jgi:hypothetical protein
LLVTLTTFLCCMSATAQTTLPANRAAPPGVRPTPGLTLPPAGAPLSRAYTVVIDRHYAANPPMPGECPREVHDRYWTYGLDGKVYPTWHPPVDPITGCAFGHEHGDDPKNSKLGNVNTALGYANEKHFELDMVNVRDEDHVGHKFFLVNEAPFGAFGQYNGVLCNLLVKVHQGTHSADALTNNLHEMHYNATCNNGIDVRWKNLHPFGPPGIASVNCTAGSSDFTFNFGPGVPANAPTGGGGRNLPDSACHTAQGINMAEDWPVDIDLSLPGGGIFGYGLYLQVNNTSRFVNFINGVPAGIARPSDICFDGTHPAYNDFRCQDLRSSSGGARIAWNDARSPWKGTNRRIHVNQLSANNPTANALVFTNVFGKEGALARNNNLGVILPQIIRGRSDGANEGPQVNLDFDHPTVRAPN